MFTRVTAPGGGSGFGGYNRGSGGRRPDQQRPFSGGDRGKRFWCDSCDRGYNDEAKFKEHNAQHKSCPHDGCPFVTTNEDVLWTHVLFLHMNPKASAESNAAYLAARKRRYPTAARIAEANEVAAMRADRGDVRFGSSAPPAALVEAAAAAGVPIPASVLSGKRPRRGADDGSDRSSRSGESDSSDAGASDADERAEAAEAERGDDDGDGVDDADRPDILSTNEPPAAHTARVTFAGDASVPRAGGAAGADASTDATSAAAAAAAPRPRRSKKQTLSDALRTGGQLLEDVLLLQALRVIVRSDFLALPIDTAAWRRAEAAVPPDPLEVEAMNAQYDDDADEGDDADDAEDGGGHGGQGNGRDGEDAEMDDGGISVGGDDDADPAVTDVHGGAIAAADNECAMTTVDVNEID